jgi:hypothetical protein
MSWQYDQDTGWISSAQGGQVAQGYSGSGAAKNNPAAQSFPNMGPIPVGQYEIGPPYDNLKTGPYTMNLTPNQFNMMYGRSEFRIHGDSLTDPGNASEGCIVLPRPVRELIWESGDHSLMVV